MCIFKTPHRSSSEYHTEQKYWNLGHSTQNLLKGAGNWEQNPGNEMMINYFCEAKVSTQTASGTSLWKTTTTTTKKTQRNKQNQPNQKRKLSKPFTWEIQTSVLNASLYWIESRMLRYFRRPRLRRTTRNGKREM